MTASRSVRQCVFFSLKPNVIKRMVVVAHLFHPLLTAEPKFKIPEGHNRSSGTLVVPGHGRVWGERLRRDVGGQTPPSVVRRKPHSLLWVDDV